MSRLTSFERDDPADERVPDLRRTSYQSESAFKSPSHRSICCSTPCQTHVGSKEGTPSQNVSGPERAGEMSPGVDTLHGGSDDTHD